MMVHIHQDTTVLVYVDGILDQIVEKIKHVMMSQTQEAYMPIQCTSNVAEYM